MEEVKQGIPIPPLELVFPRLCLRHAIHIVFGSSDLQPLTVGELSLVEDIMSGKFNFPLAKEAKALSEGAASVSQKKRKMMTLLDTRVVDDHAVAKSSTAEAFTTPAATPSRTPPNVFMDPSPARFSRRTKSKLSESEGMVIVSLLADGSRYSDTSFVKEVTDALF